MLSRGGAAGPASGLSKAVCSEKRGRPPNSFSGGSLS